MEPDIEFIGTLQKSGFWLVKEGEGAADLGGILNAES